MDSEYDSTDDEMISTNEDEVEEDEELMEEEIHIAEETVSSMSTSIDVGYLKRLRNFNFVEEHERSYIQFILMDTDIVADKRHGTLAHLFGRASPSNKSVNVIVSGWYPYMYIEEPIGYTSQKNHFQLKLALKQALLQRMDEKYPHLLKALNALECDAIISVVRELGTSIMGYQPSSAHNRAFLKIKVASPSFIQPLRECFEGGYALISEEGGFAKGMAVAFNSDGELELRRGIKTRTFNSNLEPVLQFMVDKRLSGCQWCQVPDNSHDGISKTTCDFEILRCNIDQLQLLDVSEKSDTGSIRILSFDLEAAGRKGVFPDPAIDPVIQIGIHFQIGGADREVP